jgi:hypothetical protein
MGNKFLAITALAAIGYADPGVRVGTYQAEVRTFYATRDGLPSDDVTSIGVTPQGTVVAVTPKGAVEFGSGNWRMASLPQPTAATAGDFAGECAEIRQTVRSGRGLEAAATSAGLFERTDGGAWQRLFPRQGHRSWAPVDVRGAVYDSRGRLWFASPQGAGCRDDSGAWSLYEGRDGLPYNDFTTMAAGPSGDVWFGTKIGAIHFDGKTWEYRQGLRWLPADEVRSIAVTATGDAWFATPKGVGRIARRPMTLAEKARQFEEHIDKRCRRTPLGYVHGVSLGRLGDLSEWKHQDSDNDGLWTAMYGAGECFAWAATKDPAAKRRAKAAFEALRFLQTVTQGGTPPALPGFVARTILPGDGPNPNAGQYTREKDERMRATRDRLWKVLAPRWPRSADGKWYWKADTSSDELDGHYFFYATYYDLVADTPEEKQRVREVVDALTSHLVDHNFQLIDWDGKVTRWGVYNPEALNDGPFVIERGLNSLSILSYLRVAEHMTGNPKYARAYDQLVKRHSYHANALVAKLHEGQGTGNHSDDEMAFMGYYNLLKYEKDPRLRSLYAMSMYRYWMDERPEMNPLFNFMFAAVTKDDSYTDAFERLKIAPDGNWLEQSVSTLVRYPLDTIDWRLTNSHRIDITPLARSRRALGCRPDGTALPVDERFVDHWNQNPYVLDQGGAGRYSTDGAAFLLPYYMGLYHGYVIE